MFKHVIVKTPCKAVTEGITSSPELGKPDYEKALQQHAKYIEALKQCGVDVTVLPADDAFPDSCFVEDVAVLTKKCAIITNPGAESRNQETKSMIPVIKQFFSEDCIEYIQFPGTLEGGDVMMVGDTFYVGKSARTNEEGIRQFGEILEKYGMKAVEVPLTEVLHLKTGVNYLENNNMLVSGEFITKPEFAAYHKSTVPAEEAYAANCIWVNGTVLVPAGFPTVEKLVKEMGYPVILVDTSEFRKIDGGLSCLSLRF
ncbi:dimethylarginine dimethylaminohydrolase family protein [Anaerolentibacter hominis]|uniref:dimethylarginine dimethylaminohydrolase family protein n=1 Tax=Anaerolentibacter hominis TaxID=3079009 RepID=UPI0031B809F4